MLINVSPATFKPRQSIEAKQLLDLNLDQVFPQPGTYKMNAVLHNINWEETLTSNTLTVIVKTPEGQEAEAFEFLQRRTNPALFFTGTTINRNEDELHTMQEFNQRFSETSYGDYVDFLLGKHYFYRNDFINAQGHFIRLKAKPNFPFNEKAEHFLSESRAKLQLTIQ